jgi:hypothetical protein
MTDREVALSAAVTLELFPESIRQAIIAEHGFMSRFGLPVSTTVTFLPDGNKFVAEDLYDCAQSVFDGTKHVELKEADTDAVWVADGYDPERATFLLTNGRSEISIDGYWPLQADPDKRLRSFENLASKFQLPRSVVEHWSARVKASKLSCPELISLERDVEHSFEAVASRIRREIENGSSNLQTLVPSDPVFWRLAYPTTTDALPLAEFIERDVKPRIVAGTKAYGVKFYPEALRLCIHSSVATVIGNESLSVDDFLKLADHVEKSGSMFSKLGFVEAILARDDVSILMLERIAGMIDFFLNEPEEGRFELLSNLFFFVSGRLSLSSGFDGSPVFARRLVEFSHASFLEEVLISERADATTAAFELAQRVARRAFVVGHLDAHSEARWMPEFATPHQLKAEFISRLSNAITIKKNSLKGTPLERYFEDGSDTLLSDKLRFPYSFLPGPLEGGSEQPASLPDDWKTLIESELKKDPPSVGGFNGLINGGAVFKLPADIVSLSVSALRRVDLATDNEESFSVGAFLGGLARVAAVVRNEQLADEIWQLTGRVLRRKPEALECEALFSLPTTLSAVYEGERRDKKLVEMIDFLSHCRLTIEQSSHLRACLEELLDLRPELWPRLGKACALLRSQQI